MESTKKMASNPWRVRCPRKENIRRMRPHEQGDGHGIARIRSRIDAGRYGSSRVHCPARIVGSPLTSPQQSKALPLIRIQAAANQAIRTGVPCSSPVRHHREFATYSSGSRVRPCSDSGHLVSKTSAQYPCGRALGFRTVIDVSLKVREALNVIEDSWFQRPSLGFDAGDHPLSFSVEQAMIRNAKVRGYFHA